MFEQVWRERLILRFAFASLIPVIASAPMRRADQKAFFHGRQSIDLKDMVCDFSEHSLLQQHVGSDASKNGSDFKKPTQFL